MVFIPTKDTPKEDIKVGCKSHFLDSGSFALWTKSAEYAKKHNAGRWAYYDHDEFFAYMDAYAAFIKKYSHAVDLYANVDVIPHPELSWRNLKYLEEKHSLQPVPVIHYGTPVKWLRKHVKAGYKIVGLGGLVANGGYGVRGGGKEWLDDCFNYICNTPNRLPRIKIHGFGMAGPFALRYPWYSIDSAGWVKASGFGKMMVPHKRKGKFVFDRPRPYLLPVSKDAPQKQEKGKHLFTLTGKEKSVVMEWIEFIGVPLGKTDKGDEIIERGITNCHIVRRVANLLFYEKMRESIPPYPWPFEVKKRPTLGVTV